MSTLKQWSKKDVMKIMKNNGYCPVRNSGDHTIFRNKDGNTISIPLSREPNKMLMRRLIKENNLKLCL